MPVEFDDRGLRIIGNNVIAVGWYDDAHVLQQTIYLKADNTLNIGDPGTGASGSGTGEAGGGVPGAQYLVLSLHDLLPNSRRLDIGEGLTAVDMGASSDYDLSLNWGAPTIDTIQPDDSAAAGSSTNPARSDHTHGIVAAVAGTIEPDDSAAEGNATSFSRSNHVHAIVAAIASTLSVSTSNAEGAATSFARSNHIHTITSSSAPGAAASLLASDASGYLQLVRLGAGVAPDYPLHVIGEARIDGDLTFIGAQSIETTADNLTLAPAGDLILNPTGNDVLPTTNYDINLGSLAKKYLTLYAAELWVETLVAQDTIATIGGRILVGPTTVLTSDLGDGGGDTTITVKHNEMASGDRVYLEANGKVEFMAITGAPGGGGPYTYTVTRNLDGSGLNLWYAGDAVFNTGAAGDGFIDLYSVDGVKANTEYGPTIVGNVRNSATYNDWTEHWAIGQLNGIYGYGASTFGVGLGEYAASQPHLTIDSTNGIRIFDGTATVIGQWDASGNIVVGQVAASKSNVLITAGALSIRNNVTERIGLTAAGILTIKDSGGAAVITLDAAVGAEITKKLTMPGASSAISIGAAPPTSATVGTGIWIDRTGIYGLATNVLQAKFDSVTGALTAGAGNVALDASGISVTGGSLSYVTTEAYKLYADDGVTLNGYLGLLDILGTGHELQLESSNVAGKNSYMRFDATAPNGYAANIVLQVYETGVEYARLALYSDGHIEAAHNLQVGAALRVGTVIENYGDMLFNAADGLLLLDAHGTISATSWRSQRLQTATLSGAFHQVPGRWAGTSAIRVEPAGTNEIINPSFENNVTDGWTNNGMATYAQSSAQARFGSDSMHLISDATADVVYSATVANADGGEAWTGGCYMWLVAGDFQIIIEENDGGWTNKASTAAVSTKLGRWQKVVVTATLTGGVTDARIKLQPVSTAASEVYIDGVQFEATAYPTSFISGGRGTGYAWTGAAHNSTSTRTATEVNLDAHGALVSDNNTMSFRTVVQMPYDADATWAEASARIFELRGANDNNQIWIYFAAGGSDNIIVFLNGGYRINTAALTFNAGDWLDIVLTCNFAADDYLLYINGVLAGRDTTAMTAPTAIVDWVLGMYRDGGFQSGFAFDGYAVFDRVLTAAEIGGLWSQHRPLVDAGALAVATQ